MLNIIKKLEAHNRKFVIVKHEGMYCAIEDKYITDGKINQQLNGLQMKASDNVDDCIQNTLNSVEIDWLVSEGMTKAQAFASVMGIPVEVAEMVFAGC